MRNLPCKLLLAFAFLLITLPAFGAEPGIMYVAVKFDTGEMICPYSGSMHYGVFTFR